jgi:predicted amino acid-binding ACT domain protein
VEQPGIIDNMHNALSSQGVNVLAISTTISTSFFVIPASEVIRAIDILNEAFEIPRGKV